MTAPIEARVALVTGGSRGLGAGIVEDLLAQGYAVATCSRSRTDQVDAWEKEFPDRFSFQTADVSVEADATRYVKDVVQRWGRIDVLVNNAGVAGEGMIALTDDGMIDRVVDLNIKGTLYVTRTASRTMLARRSGAIVNISSVVGLSGYRGLSVYSATKAALDGMTRALAREPGLPRDHRQQRRAGLPAHRDEPRPRRGPGSSRSSAVRRSGGSVTPRTSPAWCPSWSRRTTSS
ncbi:SDR family oxidoreductase [Nocardioides convexus]|uniref:SDR family oxidoreductase n=1 Tax=Nocardioides convexus TaxID=2712224 RepID=UPI00241835D5|nr:SDR family oxidoreductase [Nocardioides convexus]